MITKYLLELIESNNRVIVPDFGAFMIQHTGEEKNITFNDFLTFNDGLLLNQIIKDKKISKSEASEIIKGFIHAVEAKFSKGESYSLPGLGLLLKDMQGNVVFNKGDGNTDVKKEFVEPEKKNIPEEKPVLIPEPQVHEEKPFTIDESENQNVIEEPVIERKIVEEKPEKVTPIIELDKKEQTKSNYNKTTKSEPMVFERTKSNSKLSLIIIIASSIIILGVIIWALFTFNIFGLGKSKNEIPVVENASVVMDTTPAVDTTMMEEPKVEEEPYVEPVQMEKRYYIIAGSFKVQSNANRFRDKLNGEGYQSEIIERVNGYYAVCYYSYADKKEAFAKWRELRNTIPDTWILIKK